MKTKFNFLFVALLLIASSLTAKTYLVSLKNDAEAWKQIKKSNDIAKFQCKEGLNEILYLLSPGDIVWVAKGVYPSSKIILAKTAVAIYGGFAGTENKIEERALVDRDNNGKVEPWEFQNETVIDGSALNINLVGIGVESTDFTMDGLTFRNANLKQTQEATAGSGGAIYMNAKNALLSKCIIEKCSATAAKAGSQGGAIAVIEGKIDNCLIQDCKLSGITGRTLGAGVYLNGENAIMTNSTVRNNKLESFVVPQMNGGGVAVNKGKVENCIIVNNSTVGNGGGVVLVAGGRILNSVVANNVAEQKGGGIYIFDAGTIQNCTVWNNYDAGGKNLNDIVKNGNQNSEVSGNNISEENSIFLKEPFKNKLQGINKKLFVAPAEVAGCTKSEDLGVKIKAANWEKK